MTDEPTVHPHARLDYVLEPTAHIDSVLFCANDGQPWPCEVAREHDLDVDGMVKVEGRLVKPWWARLTYRQRHGLDDPIRTGGGTAPSQ